ncbi:MAG TPA: glycosyltransferase family 2 protein, partial [Blastocatellia bacterium]|nr:glycosyltransferase family 2 protein [Blastocatellia bacterium]
MPNTISFCMIAKNEEKLIGNCLSSVQEIADEIIVVDTGSTDRTVKIAQSFGARILYHKWDGNYGRAQNVFVQAATQDWILTLDGDEAIAQQDVPKIKRLVHRREFIGYRLMVRNYT